MNPLIVLRTAFSYLLLTGAFILVSFNDVGAQFASANGTTNPQTAIANKYGVEAYELGTFDRAQVISVLDQQLGNLKSQMSGNLSLENRRKLAYYQKVLYDIGFWNIAPEITLLNSLAEAQNEVGGSQTQLVNLYNQTISLIE